MDRDTAQAHEGGPPPAALRVEELTKQFGGFLAVDGVNLTVREGSIHALIGPNGAGKTTCFNLITRFLEPTRGRVIFRDQDLTSLTPAQIARKGVVRSFQICAVFPTLTVLENVRIALQRRQGKAFLFWRSEASLAELDEVALRHIESVGLLPWARAAASDLSYGRKRALELATTLALEPDLLLLDEPFAGMGHEDIETVTELIRTAARGRTVLLVEHNLGVVARLCDRISVLVRGRVLAEGSYEAISSDQRVIDAYLGQNH